MLDTSDATRSDPICGRCRATSQTGALAADL